MKKRTHSQPPVQPQPEAPALILAMSIGASKVVSYTTNATVDAEFAFLQSALSAVMQDIVNRRLWLAKEPA